MTEFYQGDIIKISGFKKQLFVIVSKNAFIRATGIFHVCPMIPGISAGPIHIEVKGKNGESGRKSLFSVRVGRLSPFRVGIKSPISVGL